MASSVPSSLPSSTNRISKVRSGTALSTSLTRSTKGAIAGSSSFTGTTIERRHSCIASEANRERGSNKAQMWRRFCASIEDQLSVEQEGCERGDEDRRDQRP